VIEVYEASEKAGDVAVVLGSAIGKLSAAADDNGGKFSSAAVKRVVQELSQAKEASENIQEKAQSGAGRLAGSSGGYVISRLVTAKKKRDGDWEEGRPKRLGVKEEQASRSLKKCVKCPRRPRPLRRSSVLLQAQVAAKRE